MTSLYEEDLIDFLRGNVQPLSDSNYGDRYRASVTLTDGLHLPCVVFRNSTIITDLAIRRFKEELSGKSIFSKSSGMGYRDIVTTFVTKGNCINDYDIAQIDKTKFAFPKTILKQIHGETRMGWTGFVGKMKDGKQFAFGTSFLMDFFNLPFGYTGEDLAEIINHSYLDSQDQLKSFHSGNTNDFNIQLIYRERPYFDCYLPNL